MKPEQIVEILKDSVKECGRIHAAQGHKCTGCEMAEHGVDCQRHLAARNLIAAGLTGPEWIPVTERLPEGKFESEDKEEGWSCKISEVVLAVTNAGLVSTTQCQVYMDGEISWVDTWGDYIPGDVTHWMPLPKPPKEETV